VAERIVRGLVAVDRGGPPGLFEPIVRPRLVARFDQAAARRVTVVVAPAGFGKSTALTQFLEHAKSEHVRITLRPESASLAEFLKLLGVAAPQTYAGTIVVDNVHFAQADLVQHLSAVVERDHLARWIFAGRGGGELPIASWLAYGIADMPIDHVDLRFTADEADELFAAQRLNVGAAEIRDLLALSDGWPTALAFAVRARGRSDDLARAGTATREMVYAYLAEQVLGELDPSDQQFLLDTALLPSLDLDVLGSVEDGAAGRVARLRKLTSFIASDNETTFHYHDLFRGFLEQQLRQRGVSAFRGAASKAATVLERSGDHQAALAAYVQAQNWPEVVRVLRTAGFGLFDRDAIGQLETALAALPQDLRDGEPAVLALVACICAFRGRFGEAEAFFGLARRCDVSDGDRAAIGERWASFLLRQGKAAEALAPAERALELREVSAAVRSGLLVTKAISLAEGGAPHEASAAVEEAIELANVLGNDVAKAIALCAASRCEFARGRLDAARAHALAALRLLQRERYPSLTARANLILYNVALERGDESERAWLLTQVGQSVAFGVDAAVEREFIAARYTAAVESGSSDHVDDAQAWLEGERRDSVASSAGFATALALQAAWSGDFATAQRIIASDFEQSSYAERLIHLGEHALYAAAAGDRETAESAAKTFAEKSQAEDALPTFGSATRARVFHALALILMERSSSANNVLRELEAGSSRLSQPLRSLVMVARSVYVHAETGGAHAELAARLADLGRLGLAGYARLVNALPLPAQASSPRFSALTKMELRVLQSLSAGETSRSIGEKFGRSSQTVDSHVKSIIKKLGCSGRREAVALARAQGVV
jgi:LuxR family maltose regulon positive regulatory protein